MFVRMLKLPRRGARPLRRVVDEGRGARRGAVPGRGEAGDDGLVGPDPARVLLRPPRATGSASSTRRSGSPSRVRSAGRCSARSTSATTSGAELASGQTGIVYFERDRSRSSTTTTTSKTAAARHPEHELWTTTGDIGYIDADGYLFLTDRKAFMIISGGVNIYPQEIEDCLTMHPERARRRGDRHPGRGDGRAGVRGGAAGPRASSPSEELATSSRTSYGHVSRTTRRPGWSTSWTRSPARPPASWSSGCSRSATTPKCFLIPLRKRRRNSVAGDATLVRWTRTRYAGPTWTCWSSMDT